MKTKMISLISGVAMVVGLGICPGALASNTSDVTKTLAGSTALELPAKAADLVTKASLADKENTAAAVVKAAINLNPSAAVAIVSAVARQNPASAPVAAVTAVSLQHQRIGLITKAAAAAAPSVAPKIVAALIKEFPQDYGVIAIAAAEGAPLAGREILAVVADYVPALQAYIQGATVSFAANDGNVPVRAVLNQSYNRALTAGAVRSGPAPTTVSSQDYNQTAVVSATSSRLAQSTALPATQAGGAGPTLAPPTFGPPYQPIPGTPATIGPGQITVQQPGGRNYSPP